MGTEIERKYLINDWDKAEAAISAYHKEGYAGFHIRQGYLNTEPSRTVRIRVIGQPARLAFLTIKGLSVGISRPEFEYSVPPEEGEQLLQLCDSKLEKIRYTLLYKGKVWEIDEFLGDNAGLRLAEIEMKSEDEQYEKPDWLGEDVSHDPQYYNSNLCVPKNQDRAAPPRKDDLDAYIAEQCKNDPGFAEAFAEALARRKSVDPISGTPEEIAAYDEEAKGKAICPGCRRRKLHLLSEGHAPGCRLDREFS